VSLVSVVVVVLGAGERATLSNAIALRQSPSISFRLSLGASALAKANLPEGSWIPPCMSGLRAAFMRYLTIRRLCLKNPRLERMPS